MKMKELPASQSTDALTRAANLKAVEPKDGDQSIGGAIIRGRVISRSRREVKNREGHLRYNISVAVLAGAGVFVIQRWSDEALPADLPVVGQDVEIPVRLGAYVQGGVPKVRVEWENGETTGAF
jgi:hypothetical protein